MLRKPNALATYQERLRAHLAEYKRNVLRVTEDGVWSRNGRAYPHILPQSQRELNFLPAIRREALAHLSRRPDVRLHRDFHHLNSSQAMCMNLMFPLLLSCAAREALATNLGLASDVDPRTLEFEWVPDPVEGTNFDFFMRTSDGHAVYFEFKLSEFEFGGAVGNERQLAKLRTTYAPRLGGMVHESQLEPEHFFARYQLFRNLSYLVDLNSLLVLVVPRLNVRLISQAKAFVASLSEATARRVRITHMEDLANVIKAAEGPIPKDVVHPDSFEAKYALS